MRGAMRIDKRSERAILIVLVLVACWTPALVLAQAAGGGPFSTGATNFQSSLLTILGPSSSSTTSVTSACACWTSSYCATISSFPAC